jgi:hypothetical protein
MKKGYKKERVNVVRKNAVPQFRATRYCRNMLPERNAMIVG